MTKHEAIAEIVVRTLKRALTPVLASLTAFQERLAAIEARPVISPTEAELRETLDVLRERVAVLDAKEAARPVVMEIIEADTILVDLRARMGLLESKGQSDTATWEARWNDVGALRERVALVETKAAQPAPVPPELRPEPDVALVDLRARLGLLESKGQGDTTAPEIAGLRERIAVLETRAPVAGPPGTPGVDAKGEPGRDGTLENIKALFDGERTVTLCFKDGTPIEGGTITFPVDIYRGVYSDGKTYDRGDGVTWGGSEWHCNEPTTMKPGDGSKAWTLKVKRGRDGKDGQDAPGAIPVVRVR